MHLYSLSLQKSTAIVGAIYGNFSSPKSHEFVVSRGKLLELLRQKSGGQPRARAPLLAAAELWSRLAALTQPPPVAGARAREAIVAYVEALGDRDACSYDLVQVSTRLETV